MFKCSWLIVLLATGLARPVQAFSLLGPGGGEANPAKLWQLRGDNAGWSIGYDLIGDIGGPMDKIEFYRWNVPVITYAFEASFRDYFGTNGMKAVEQAFDILNALPGANKMSTTLEEFPLSTLRPNYEAIQLGLIDVKSTALSLILEEMGLAQPERWVWSIRHREPIPNTQNGVYDVIRYNYDPATELLSPYVNGTLYTYFIEEVPPPGPGTPFSEAVEQTVPIDVVLPNFSVASQILLPGYFFTGLTRDDVGAIRYLLHPQRRAMETLLPTVSTANGAAWLPVLGTNAVGTNVNGTNNIITAGVRGGVNKIKFQKVHFDDLVGGTFTPITNRYTDRVSATNRTFEQVVARGITRPDIVFTVEDLGQLGAGRTDTSGWINNDLLTPEAVLGGPGVITPPITITYNMLFPIFFNQTPDFITEPPSNDPNFGYLRGLTWASFDGTTNAPVLYPVGSGYTLRDARQAARQGGF